MKRQTVRFLLERIARDAIDAGFPIVRASIRMLTDDGAGLQIVAVWGKTSDVIRIGSLLGVGATSFPEVVRTDGPVTSGMVDETLAGEVLRSEGIRSWIAVPLRDSNGLPVGLLNLSSSEAKAFPNASLAFFEATARELEREIL